MPKANPSTGGWGLKKRLAFWPIKSSKTGGNFLPHNDRLNHKWRRACRGNRRTILFSWPLQRPSERTEGEIPFTNGTNTVGKSIGGSDIRNLQSPRWLIFCRLWKQTVALWMTTCLKLHVSIMKNTRLREKRLSSNQAFSNLVRRDGYEVERTNKKRIG